MLPGCKPGWGRGYTSGVTHAARRGHGACLVVAQSIQRNILWAGVHWESDPIQVFLVVETESHYVVLGGLELGI